MSNAGIHVKAVNLSKKFSKGGGALQIIQGVDLEVPAGDSLAIIGASGAGKSTLLYLLAGLDQPTQGQVSLDGVIVSELGESARAALRNRNVGFIFQFHHLLKDFSAEDNVAMPLLINRVPYEDAIVRARELIDQVGLKERLTHKPGELSGGEQQRIALARAFVHRPKLIFADEPTGNLDKANGSHIQDLLLNMNRQHGSTLILVTHNDALARVCRRVVKLDEGRIVEQAAAQ